MSIEAILETAYKAVTVANQSELVGVEWYLACQTTNQNETIEKIALPSITLTATAAEEMVPNSGVFRVALEIACEDAAVRKEGPAIRLDDVFRFATRPLLYKPLVAMITAAANGAEGFKCFGLPERTENHSIQFGEGTMQRSASAFFICSTEIGLATPPLVS